MRTRSRLWLVLFGLLVVGSIAEPDMWAAPGQSPARQTVVTRTPVKTDTPEPTASPTKSKPNKPSSTPVSEATPTIPSVGSEATVSGDAPTPLLPDAGGRSIGLQLGMAMVVIGLFLSLIAGRHA